MVGVQAYGHSFSPHAIPGWESSIKEVRVDYDCVLIGKDNRAHRMTAEE